MSFGQSSDEVHQNNETKAAIDFTRKFINDHNSINDDDFSTLRPFFTEKEISALCAFISFMGGANKFGAMVGLTQSDIE